MSAEFVIPAITIVFLGVIYSLFPMFQKRNLYFGVTVSPEFRASDEGRRIAMVFRVVVWLGVAVTLVVLWYARQLPSKVLSGFCPLLAVGVASVGWLWGWSAARRHAVRMDAVRTAPLLVDPEDEHLPGGWLTAVGPFAMLSCAVGWMLAHFDELPARYPVHWGASGQADRWVEKSLPAVLAPSAVGAGVLVMLLGIALMILRGAKRGSGGESGDFGARHRMANVRMLAVMLWALGALFCVVALLPVLKIPSGPAMFVIMLSPVAVILLYSVRLYSLSTEQTGGSDGMPEDCWKFGSIYYNPADPALMVEKRSGPGFTFNFGNRLSWVVLAGLLALIFVPLFLVR
jgi:uncharacterized membrane protein